VHVLRVQLDRGREEVQLLAEGLEEAVGVAGVMRSEIGIIVFAGFRRRDEVFLSETLPAAHADEPAGLFAFPFSQPRSSAGPDVVRVA
jgi:hypothetical protein